MPDIAFPQTILALLGGMAPFGFPIPFDIPLETGQMLIDLALLFLIAFLLGSIPWGVIISKVFFKKDVRDEGSGNIGATNSIRALGKFGGAVVFLLDFGKGLLSGYLGMLLSYALLASGYPDGCIGMPVAFLGCVLGHIFSPWLGFRGGKGIAVGVGCLFFTLGYWIAITELLIFAGVVVISRYVSLGSVVSTSVAALFSVWVYWGNWIGMLFMIAGAILIIWAHRGNISRLANGTESRIGAGKKTNDG